MGYFSNLFLKILSATSLTISFLLLKLPSLKLVEKILSSHFHARFEIKLKEVKKILCSISAKFSWLDNCLVRALAFCLISKLTGDKLDLVIGIKKEGKNNLDAHAWVLKDEKIILGDNS